MPRLSVPSPAPAAAPDEGLLCDAEAIDQYLRSIRRTLLQAYAADQQRLGLTLPQLQAMAILARGLQDNQDGMTIRALSERMGLAQSTISSLVERLERKQLVSRQVDPADRRYTRIHLTNAVRSYLQYVGPEGHLRPLFSALERASAQERKTICDGFATLHRLLNDQG